MSLAGEAGILYGEKKYNCAEAILRSGCRRWNIELDEKSLLAASGFGTGMNIESSCGALTGGIMVLSLLFTTEKAANSPELKRICSEFLNRFAERYGSTICSELKAKYRKEDTKCRGVVEMAAELLEEIVEREIAAK
jgi:C_GCAxxG_C_C family probable redox protein